MALQISLIYGFSLAASRIVDAVAGDIWIVAKAIPAFEFVSPISERVAWLAAGVPGVRIAGSGVGGWFPFEKANGDRTTVFLVGVEKPFVGRLPIVRLASISQGGFETPIAADLTDVPVLVSDKARSDARVEVNGRRADLALIIRGFSSFLGTPFALADYQDAVRLSRYPQGMVSFALASVRKGKDPMEVAELLRKRFPEFSVFTSSEFSWRSRIFWLLKTGAGGALSLAAILGFLIGLSVVAQTIYSATAEQVEEYATMKALGASDRFVFYIVAIQSITCGIMGSLGGLLLVEPFAVVARNIVTWVVVPVWVYPIIVLIVILLCISAAVIAARPAIQAEPARVFRA